MIGAGAMGAVWSARNESTDRDFALKLMLPDAATNPVALQRFFQEAKASGRLRHRCIVEVYDLGRIEQLAGKPTDPHAGTPYLVMELLEGEPLDSVIRRVKFLPPGTALKLVADVARGLDVAHNQRIVHRDLKPGNIFLHKTLEGTIVPKILDFGISKLVGPQHDPIATSAGTVLGSPAYMSPEQASGEIDVDGRSDVWSLGVILYKCLCGSVPFAAANYNALMMAITRQIPQPILDRVPGIPSEVGDIVNKCLSKERAGRFATAKEMAGAIDAVLAKHTLERVELTEIVTVPVELTADDAKTIAVERSVGTLAATEVDDQAATRAVDSSQPAHVSLVQLSKGDERSETAAPVRVTKPRRSVIAAAVGAVIVVLITIIAIARRPSSETNANAPTPAPVNGNANELKTASLAVPQSPPEKTAAPTPSAKPTSTTTTAGATTASATTVASAAPSATTKLPKVATGSYIGKPKPPATASAKSVHEGVTSSGI